MNIQLADETVTTDRGVPAILWTLVCDRCGEECWWVDAPDEPPYAVCPFCHAIEMQETVN